MYNYLKNCKIIIGVFIIWPFFSLATSHGAELSGSFKTPISLTGIIEPAIILNVQSSVGGRVEVLHVKENQYVPKNQLLLTLNNDTQKRQLELTLLQHKVNETLDAHIKNKPSSQLKQPAGAKPQHINFI